MDKEEAIERFEKQLHSAMAVLDIGFGTNPGENDLVYRKRKEMAEWALKALYAMEDDNTRGAIPDGSEYIKAGGDLALLPCPFCGSEEVMYEMYPHRAGERVRVVCMGCMAMLDPGYAQQKYTVRDMWNKRTAAQNIAGKSPFPDGDTGIICCPRCGSGEYLHNGDGNENEYCGQCGQWIDWEKKG